MDHDLGRDLNALGGSPDRPVDQRIRSLETHLFGVSAGDERFKLDHILTGTTSAVVPFRTANP